MSSRGSILPPKTPQTRQRISFIEALRCRSAAQPLWPIDPRSFTSCNPRRRRGWPRRSGAEGNCRKHAADSGPRLLW
jgi:hypothetical protein